MSVRVPMLGVATPARSSARHKLEGLPLLHVGEQQILRVRDPHLAETVAVG